MLNETYGLITLVTECFRARKLCFHLGSLNVCRTLNTVIRSGNGAQSVQNFREARPNEWTLVEAIVQLCWSSKVKQFSRTVHVLCSSLSKLFPQNLYSWKPCSLMCLDPFNMRSVSISRGGHVRNMPDECKYYKFAKHVTSGQRCTYTTHVDIQNVL